MTQAVCKYVTIVIRIIVEIRLFFMVFALGILSFSLAIQHLLRGCASNGSDDNRCEKDSATDFPRNFLGAIVSTYFIMVKRPFFLGNISICMMWVQSMVDIFLFFITC